MNQAGGKYLKGVVVSSVQVGHLGALPRGCLLTPLFDNHGAPCLPNILIHTDGYYYTHDADHR